MYSADVAAAIVVVFLGEAVLSDSGRSGGCKGYSSGEEGRR